MHNAIINSLSSASVLDVVCSFSPEAIYLLDFDGRVRCWSSAAERLFGWTSEEMEDADVAVLAAKELGQEDHQLVQRVLRGERVVGFATQRRHKGGGTIDVEMTLSTVPVDDGEPVAICVFARDVTECNRVRRENLISCNLFATVFKASPDLMAITRIRDNRLLEVNAGCERMLGYTREEIVGTTAADLGVWADPEARERFLEQLLARGSVVDFETVLLNRDGIRIAVTASARMFELDDEWYMVSMVHDISRRKASELALLASEQKLKAHIEQTLLGVIEWDARFCAREWNSAAESIFGYTREEAVGRHAADLILPASEREKAFHTWSELLKGEDGRLIVFENTRKDGTPVICEWVNTPLRGPDGSIEAVMSLARDVTERTRAEARLAKALTSITEVVSLVTEQRDPYTAGHQRRVSQLAMALARRLGFSEAEIEQIRIAGLIHDVGKLSVPAEILSKPSTLCLEEFDLIKRHVEAGYRITVAADMEPEIARMVLEHHERGDGTGYPRGLHNEELLPGSRVLIVADVVEAMVSHRPYRPSLGMAAALDEIRDGAGTRYDADAAAACLELLESGEFTFEDWNE